MDESNKQIQQPEEERTLEEEFQELEQVLEAMEQEVTLEESFRLYHRGIDLLKACSDKIDRAGLSSEEGRLPENHYGGYGIQSDGWWKKDTAYADAGNVSSFRRKGKADISLYGRD